MEIKDISLDKRDHKSDKKDKIADRKAQKKAISLVYDSHHFCVVAGGQDHVIYSTTRKIKTENRGVYEVRRGQKDANMHESGPDRMDLARPAFFSRKNDTLGEKIASGFGLPVYSRPQVIPEENSHKYRTIEERCSCCLCACSIYGS